MRMRFVDVIGFGFAASALAACGGLQASDLFTADGGTSTVSETGTQPDTAVTPADSGSETSSPVSKDASTLPTPPDSGTGARDALSIIDAVTPPQTDAGAGMPCGETTCEGSRVCCVTGVGTNQEDATCADTKAACTGTGGAPITCSPDEGCSGSYVCCVGFTYSQGGMATLDSVSCVSTTDCKGYDNASGKGETPACDPGEASNTCPEHEQCAAYGSSGYGACTYTTGG